MLKYENYLYHKKTQTRKLNVEIQNEKTKTNKAKIYINPNKSLMKEKMQIIQKQ